VFLGARCSWVPVLMPYSWPAPLPRG